MPLIAWFEDTSMVVKIGVCCPQCPRGGLQDDPDGGRACSQEFALRAIRPWHV
jgi:hypothetical protein